MTGLERLFAVLPEGVYTITRMPLGHGAAPNPTWMVEAYPLVAYHDDLETALGRVVEMMLEERKKAGGPGPAAGNPQPHAD